MSNVQRRTYTPIGGNGHHPGPHQQAHHRREAAEIPQARQGVLPDAKQGEGLPYLEGVEHPRRWDLEGKPRDDPSAKSLLKGRGFVLAFCYCQAHHGADQPGDFFPAERLERRGRGGRLSILFQPFQGLYPRHLAGLGGLEVRPSRCGRGLEGWAGLGCLGFHGYLH